MAMLSCRHCSAPINSDTRSTQCKKCGALFPFVCKVCSQQLRPPFPVFDDERYLTLQDEPLCPKHFLRKCPDCGNWFQADENPGFFRCKRCAEAPRRVTTPTPVPRHDEPEEMDVPVVRTRVKSKPGMSPNVLVLGGAGGAFLMLLAWYLFHK